MIWREIPAVGIVFVGIPEVARPRVRHDRRPGRIAPLDVVGHEDLVLEREVDRPGVEWAGQVVGGDETELVVVVDDVGRGDPGVRVEARRSDGVVVIPLETGSLGVGVVVLGLVGRHDLALSQHGVVDEARAFVAGGIPPGVGTTIARPGDVAAMQVDVGPVVRELGAHDRAIDGQDVAVGQMIAERELDRCPALDGDDSAEVPEVRCASLAEAPQSRGVGQVGMQLIRVLADPDGVVGHARLPPGLDDGVGLGDGNVRPRHAERTDELAQPVAV